MLYLLKQESGSTFLYLISGKEYVVGRKNADITITDDQSISRQHAIIKVGSDSVKIIDCGSKYGTVHKGNKIQPNTEVELEDQDIIKFGVFQSIYKIEKANIVTTGSGLSNTQKNSLKKNLEFFGGTFLNNWDSTCTYLTVQEIMLTIKVLHALIDGKPFVTLEFWSKFAENVKGNKPLPEVEDFKPKVAEVLLNTSAMDPNPQRRVLFKGKTFVFPNDKLKLRMEDLILKTGGECISWEQQHLELLQVTNSRNKYIFIHSDEVKQIPDSLKNIHDHLRKLGQRTIPVQEIAMAVMMCSCEKDCNPFFDRIQKVFFKEENDSSSQIFPLAGETQSQDFTTQPKEEIVIPGSLDADIDWQPVKPKESKGNCGASTSTATPKRPSEESLENLFKKPKMDNVKEQTFSSSRTNKRKADEILEAPPRKSNLKENPFAILKKRNNQQVADNPFANIKLKQEKNLDNPFIEGEKSPNEGMIEMELSSQSGSSSSLSGSSSNHYNKSKCTNISDIKWLSKNLTADVKPETSVIEETFKEIYDRFQNTVIIEVLPFTRRSASQSDSLDGTIKSESGKNFKKFKKVRPLRAQNSVIRATVSQIANTTGNNEITVLSDGEEEDDEAPRPIRKKVIQSNKRFGF